MTLQHYSEPVAVLGEGPVWDAQGGHIWWVDCDQKKLFHRDPGPGAEAGILPLPHYPSAYAFRRGGGMLMAYRNGLAMLDPATGKSDPFEATGLDFSRERFNDGICDRAGRFWIGTMDPRMKERNGSLYRIDPDLAVTRMASGLVVSNGISFSPDDRTMYHHDSRSKVVFAYDFDIDKGDIRNQRVFIDFTGRPGNPDGGTTDAEGNLWIAEIGAGRVVQFDPRGRQIRAIELPVTRPSSVMFGGKDLSTLFITSMRHGLKPEELAQQPLAGCLFHTRVDVPGMEEPQFAG
ncbi:SMP-30/gluconolactonase/LRE family protein [Pigmentiphaga soli]|uniref:SMP-30/gluconolactonase/LRE family protein n=1 Tax=Pigmentiphaga soli TaxID=1007095 RepID=A0ABP8HGH0_9BURK